MSINRPSIEPATQPFIHLRLPLLFNLRRDPFEMSQQNSNTYHDWSLGSLEKQIKNMTTTGE